MATFTEYTTGLTAASQPNYICMQGSNTAWFTELVGNKIGSIFLNNGAITEYNIPTANAQPVGITLGSDNRLYFCEFNTAKIGAITTGGSFTEYSIPGGTSQPAHICAGPNGDLWFADFNTNAVWQMTTGGSFTKHTITGITSTYGIATGPLGIYFTDFTGGHVGHIDPNTFSFTVLNMPNGSNSQPISLIQGGDNRVWIACFNDNHVVALSNLDAFTQYDMGAGAIAADICKSADSTGSVFLTDYNANKLRNVDATGTVTNYTIPTGASNPTGIACYSDIVFCEKNTTKIGTLSGYAGQSYFAVFDPTVESQPTATQDFLVLQDSLSLSIQYRPTEFVLPRESFATVPVTALEPALLRDALSLTISRSFDEPVRIIDSVSANRATSQADLGTIKDSLSRTVTLFFEDRLLGRESYIQDNFALFDNYYDVEVSVADLVDGYFGIKPEVEQAFTGDSYAINIPVLQNTLVAVTNATSVGNPFAATLVLNGTVLYQGTGNPAPATRNNTSIFLKFLSAGVTGLSLCELFSFGFNLDYNGGHFSVTSKQPLGGSFYQFVNANTFDFLNPPPYPVILDYQGIYPYFRFFYPTAGFQTFYAGSTFGSTYVPNNLGQHLDFFGFKGTIIESGRIRANSADGFTAAGIFGNPLMNRQFNLLGYGNSTFTKLIYGTSPVLGSIPPQSTMTVRAAAQTIISIVSQFSVLAGLGEIKLQWAVQDAPYFDTISNAGDTGIQALSNLAARVGGTLRWDGNNTYTVAYPDVAFGSWIVPNCSLIDPNGLQDDYILDLGTGRTGTGTVLIPALNQVNNAINNLPGASAANGQTPTVSQVNKTSKILTSDDPPIIWDLPQDYDTVYIQILVPANGDSTGIAPIALESWVTKDPQQWFVFNVASLSGSNSDYIFLTNIGGKYIPQVKLDSRVFPTGNTSINDGHFMLSIACTTKNLNSEFAQSQQEHQDISRMLAEYHVHNYQFVKTYSGTIHCMFFGSIPLPGMYASATSGDFTVSGIVENVSFQYPCFLTVEVARYLRLDLLKPPLTWNAQTSGQYIGIPIGT